MKKVKFNPPSKVSILGQSVKVKLEDAETLAQSHNGLPVYGDYTAYTKTIRINREIENIEESYKTMVHEIFHALCCRIGITNQDWFPPGFEEIVVENFASVIVDNFELKFKKSKKQ